MVENAPLAERFRKNAVVGRCRLRSFGYILPFVRLYNLPLFDYIPTFVRLFSDVGVTIF